MTSALDIVGKRLSNMPANGYARGDIIIGAPYLITRDWTDSHVVIARKRASHNTQVMEHDGSNWYATLINPPVKVGDTVFALSRAEQGERLRSERQRKVLKVTDEGIMTQYLDGSPFLVTHWVLAQEIVDRKRDRYNPDRRQIVLDRLGAEGMDRIGDTGYAVSAAEFFTHFDLPRPEVEPTAVLDVERKYDHVSMPRDLRYELDNVGVTSLRTAVVTGRAKVRLARSACRCKEITEEEVTSAWRHGNQWKIVKVHKVECLWCTDIARLSDSGDPF